MTIICQFENGVKKSLRHITIDALIVKNKQILLIKRGPHSFVPDKYALPGGFLERNETTRQGVLREVKEETGYLCKILSLFRINDSPKRKGENRQNVAFVFLLKPVKKGKPTDKNQEVSKIEWFSLDNLPLKKDFAFDHWENIELFKKWQKEKFKLPLLK